jgi:hypothetical protein
LVPLSSVEIANLNGVYMQQGMLAQQTAGMIGSLGAPPGMGPSFGEHVMGRAVNTGTAIGGPVAAGMLGLAGMDPVSLALKGGSMGFRAGGFGGAAMGAGAGLAVGAGAGMVASYAVDQMVRGIQQQQQLTSALQTSFQFQNPYGTTGFTGTQSRMIGSQLSSMQGFAGAGGGGQMVGFEELSRLASNMGRMGMAGGVRDVKEFTTRFKEMLTSVKVIAHDMQTSLEEAQKLMSDMRGAGVFGPGRAASFAQQIRATAVAAGVSTAEVTGMMGVGSQISRMTGGLGRQGARAGIEALANVGSATQVGAINEEAIYNVTGLTGAEGRRAFATRMMEQSNKFLRGTQGRYFLASVAGANGKLNEDSVQEYMSGGVGVEDTRRMAHENLSKVGRADFIRNEGRLRASVMERFGGLETVMSMQQWMASRGVSMDDPRARLYLQRARGMGRDEADSMIQMAQNLPQILEQRKEAAHEDEISKRIAEARSHVGIEGLKRKIEEARNSVQKKLAEPARALFQSGSDMLNDFIGKLTGEFTVVQYRHLDELTRAAKGLGAGGAIARQQLTGGVGRSAGMQALAKGEIGGILGEGPSALDNFMRDDAERFRAAGFGVHATRDETLTQQLRVISQIGVGAKAGMGEGAQAKLGMALGKALTDQIQAGAALRGTGEGFSTITNFEKTLREAAAGGSKEARAALSRWGSMSQKDKAAMVTSAYRGAGMDVSGLMTSPERNELLGMRAGPTGALHERVGEALTPGSRGVGGFFAELFGHGSTGGQQARAVGAIMDTEEFMNLGKKMLGGNELLRAGARKDVTTEMATLQNSITKGNASSADRARYQALGGLLATQNIDDAMARSGAKRPEDLPPEEIDKLVKKFGALGVTSREELFKMARTTAGFMALKSDEQYKQWSANVVESSHHRMESLKATGAITEKGQLSGDVSKLLKSMKGTAGEKFLANFLSSAIAGSKSGDNRAMGENYLKSEQNQTQAIADMSVSDMHTLEQKLSSVSPEAARMLRAERSGRQRLEMGRARGGQAGGLKMVAGMLGENVSNEELRMAMRGGGKGINALADSLVEGSGVSSGDSRKELGAALQSYLKGEKGGAGKLQGIIEGNSEIADAKKKRSLAEAEDQNPLQATANKSLASIDKKLDDLVKIRVATGDTAELTRANKEADTG